MTVYFKQPEPEPVTKWFYVPGTKVLWVKEIAEAFSVQVRTA